MPEHTSHELFGVAVWIILLVLVLLVYPNDLRTAAQLSIVGFVFCFLGSILPDIDEKHSVVFKHVRFLVFLVVFVLTYTGLSLQYPKDTLFQIIYILAVCFLIAIAAVLFLYAIIPAHRKGIHSILAGAVYGVLSFAGVYALLLAVWPSVLIAVFGFLAYLSHLVLDRSLK